MAPQLRIFSCASIYLYIGFLLFTKPMGAAPMLTWAMMIATKMARKTIFSTTQKIRKLSLETTSYSVKINFFSGIIKRNVFFP